VTIQNCAIGAPETQAARCSVAQVIHSVTPEHGGTSTFVTSLCEELGALGHRVRLHATDFGPRPTTVSPLFDLHLHHASRWGARFGFSADMHRALQAEAREADIIHSHGLWLWTNLDVHRVTRQTGQRGSAKRPKVVLSPHGMLEPYALERQKLAKRLIWHVGQGAALRASDCLHVTAESELRSVRALGLENPVAIVPPGVTMPTVRLRTRGSRRTLLFLGRLDPKKGIDLLLKSWSSVAETHLDWDLCIAGPGSANYTEQMRRLCQELNAPRVRFTGPVYDRQRDELMAEAELFVLPTRSENFGITVAEALSFGVPVLCTKGAPWQELTKHGCGWWVDVDVDALRVALHQALALSTTELASLGERGREWIGREYTSRAQAVKMSATYEWLRTHDSKPSYIHTLA
jgi:glycosyltransferase involved in cell wall biosynthesis